MKIERTEIEGVYIIDNFNAADDRGFFVKSFNRYSFKQNNLDFKVRELFYSVSKKDVVRGMHFQLPPHDHEKLVFVPTGSIMDVVVDLRKNSSTFKKSFSIELSAENKKSIFIPKGIAHGFKSLEDNTITVYSVTTEHNPTADTGIHYNSFRFNWQIENPILSQKDLDSQSLNEFCKTNPF